MSVNITDTNRVGELPPTPILMANKIPHEAGTDLGQATVQELADLIKDYIGTSSSLAFNPTTVTDGGNLPATTSNEWMLVGKGTFNNVGGGEQIICTEELSAITSNGSFWSISVEIPINVELAGVVQNIRSGYVNTVPSEDAVFNALVEKIGDVSDNKIYARTQGNWVEIDLSTSSIEVDDFEYATGLQQFNLSNTASQILSVSVNGWSTENYTVINSDTILINDVIGMGQQVVIRYLTDLTTGISPYYTKLQTDALIAGVGGGVTTHDIISTDIFIDPDEYVDTASVAFIQGFWYNIGDYVFVEVSFEVFFFPSNAEDSGSFLLTFLNGLNVVTFIGKIVKGDSLYTLTETFYTAKVEGFSANKVKIKYNGSTSAETSHIVSVRFNFKTT
jgi:hypothetical protein